MEDMDMKMCQKKKSIKNKNVYGKNESGVQNILN
jgi:hypothetical protein